VRLTLHLGPLLDMVNTRGPWPDPRLRALIAHWNFPTLPWRVHWRRWVSSPKQSISPEHLQASSSSVRFSDGQSEYPDPVPGQTASENEGSPLSKRRRLEDTGFSHPLESISIARTTWQKDGLFGTVVNGSDGGLEWWAFVMEGQSGADRDWEGLSCTCLRSTTDLDV
jgi:hypothetical protein